MTEKSVADELDRVLGRMSRRWRAIQEKVEKGTLPRDQVLAALQAIFDGRFAQPVTPGGTIVASTVRQRPRLLHGRYTPIDQQVKNLWRWNRTYGWGLAKGWDDQLDVPEWPNEALVSVNLVAFLEAKGGVLGEHRTFDAYWEIIRAQHPNASRWAEVKAEPDHLRLLPGITHVPGVRIEVIDHGANWDKTTGLKPMDVRSPETSPHAGLLASVAQHPKRIRKMDGTAVPFEWIAGYQVSVPGDDPWRNAPIFDWYRDERQVGLRAGLDDDPSPDYSVPGLRRLAAGSGAR